MTMLWVDHESYYGPDRRRKHGGLRLRERRRYDIAGQPPSLSIALRQLRMRVLDAQGPGAASFANRAQGVAHIARMHHEQRTAEVLIQLAATVSRARGADIRQSLYGVLDRAQAAMSA